jgi:uncharacterized protein
MPTFKPLLGFLVAGVLAALPPGAPVNAAGSSNAAKDMTKFKSSVAALQQGLNFYKKGDYARALPALEFAAADNQFMAQFTLAELYSDNAGAETDHAKAYMLYQSIADEHSDADPDDEKRAPFVAKALTALAGYLRVGLPEIGLKPDPDRAADYLHHAALFFGDEDAQFELVKIKLKGDGIPADIASAKHWLSVLTQRGHAGAQAFLADLYWRGKLMEQDKVRAFALISVAVQNAPPRERIWIEDVYQNIFCGAGEGVRKQATGIVADWRARYGRKAEEAAQPGLDPLYPLAVRTCQNGDRVEPMLVPAVQPDVLHPKTEGGPVQSFNQQAVSTGSLQVGSSKSEGLPTPGLAQGLMPLPGTSAR